MHELIHLTFLLQILQEMELIAQREAMFAAFQHEWLKWIPAIVQYAEKYSKKSATAAASDTGMIMLYRSMLISIVDTNFISVYVTVSGKRVCSVQNV